MASVDPGLLLGQLREEQAELRRRRTGRETSEKVVVGGVGGRKIHFTSRMGGDQGDKGLGPKNLPESMVLGIINWAVLN